ncbi:MAG: lysophospholipase [Dehalococcoidia bacterium]
MKHREGTFSGLGDISIYCQSWLPDGDVRAVLLLVHGYAEHSGRYGNLVEYFVSRGFAIHALDHRGHGKSGGERVHVDDFSEYVADVKTLFDRVRAEHEGLPIFLLGHSMGAFIAIAYVARYQHELTGLVLSGGGAGTNRPAGSGPPPQIDLAATVSKDPAVVEAYRNDPLNYHGQPPESRRNAMAALREQLPDMVRSITLPAIIMAGSASPLGDGPGSETLFGLVSSQDKTLKLYEGLMHEIFNEPERDQVFADLHDWLLAHKEA